MAALIRHCSRAVMLSLLVVLVLALGAALVRLLPWLLSPEVPLGVALPFAKALVAVAFEAAFLVGVPAGCGLGTALFVERGEARALHSLGLSPLGLALRALPVIFGCCLLGLTATSLAQASTDNPGRFARALIERGREGCDSARPRSVSVPIVGVTWLCFEQGTPRLTGPVPESGGRAWFSARTIGVTDDFTAFEAKDVYVATPQGAAKLRFGLSVGAARVAGLPAWGKSSPLGLVERGALLAGSLGLLGFTAVWVVARLGWCNRTIVGGFSGLAGVLALRGLHAQPAGGSLGWILLEVLAGGLAVLLLPLALTALNGQYRRWRGRWEATL